MILVTGGTGLVGSHLLLELTKKHSQVVAIKRKNSDINKVKETFKFYVSEEEANKLFNKIIWREADLLDVIDLDEAMDGVTEIYHCAALVSFNPKDKDKIFETNVIGTRNIVNVALKHKVKKFIHTSSIAALGDNPEGYIDEETYAVADEKTSSYAKSKYFAELEVWRGQEEGLNVIIVNPSVILGPMPDLKRKLIGKVFLAVWYGLPYYIEGTTGFVDVRDVAKAMVLLSEKEIFGERFILNSENLEYKQLLQYIAQALGVEPPAKPVPKAVISFIQFLNALKSILTFSNSMLNRETSNFKSNIQLYSNKKFLTYFPDYKFIPIKESINFMAQIFLNQLSEKEKQDKGKKWKALKSIID